MSRNVNTTFTLEKESASGARLGTIQFGERGKLQTPALFPAICIMTGPPGFGRQGSHYKYIKRAMCRDWRHNHFLTEILHFTDYMATKRSLDCWLKKPFQTWMDEMMRGGNVDTLDQGRMGDFDYERAEKPYENCFFLDSGGFKLLSNSDFSIEKFGYPTEPKSILELQTKMGGDIIASLDYPLAPLAYDTKSLVQLQNKSLENALWLLKAVDKRKGKEPKPLIYLAVHGVDYETAHDYTDRLLQKIDRLGTKYSAFGFAIGSLVPRRTNRGLVASIVKGVTDAIREHRNGFYSQKPVHAFGMSGDLIPTLVMLGVDTFDTNSFVQTGKNLKYILPARATDKSVRETRSIDELSADTLRMCGCRACKSYGSLIEPLKRLVRLERDKRHQVEGSARDLIKSEAYAFLSMHNLEIEFREIERVKAEIAKNTLNRYVLDYAQRSNNRGNLIRAYEAATGQIVPRPDGRRVSLNLTRDSFTIPDSYRPPEGKDILLLLPCSKDKPYKSARSHQAIRGAVPDLRVHVVTISGLYGPVPEELEEQPEVLFYDYVLSPEAKEQTEEVTRRVTDYLRRYGTNYKFIAAYVTGRAYRIVAKRALKAYGKGLLLPSDPKEQTSKEFLRYENVRELQQALLSPIAQKHRQDAQLALSM
jgi:7-cyano-7-deazaguanine tRNA-ribosyltransferase